jgi:acyl-CoA synthetase (NDP forming)
LLPSEARDMIQGIDGFQLLEGVRGEAGADLALLEEILLRLAQLSSRHPEIVELDVNPFLAASDRKRAVAVDARVRISRSGA